jgi:hypothetical protein
VKLPLRLSGASATVLAKLVGHVALGTPAPQDGECSHLACTGHVHMWLMLQQMLMLLQLVQH